jgi:hypothetical protein
MQGLRNCYIPPQAVVEKMYQLDGDTFVLSSSRGGIENLTLFGKMVLHPYIRGSTNTERKTQRGRRRTFLLRTSSSIPTPTPSPSPRRELPEQKQYKSKEAACEMKIYPL